MGFRHCKSSPKINVITLTINMSNFHVICNVALNDSPSTTLNRSSSSSSSSSSNSSSSSINLNTVI